MSMYLKVMHMNRELDCALHPQAHTAPPLRVFTTRPDTLYGVSFVAVSPEHDLLQESEVHVATHCILHVE